MSKLVLGTVQLGLNYGISNTIGKPDQNEADAIVNAAIESGINHFDTAKEYGDSEEVLGRSLKKLNHTEKAQVITKFSPTFFDNETSLESAMADSLLKLGVSTLYCLMLHWEEQITMLDSWQGKIICKWLDLGLVKHIGISVYSPEYALMAVNHPIINIIQIPSSIFDRRFEQLKIFDLAKKNKKELHVRSVFLQGLIGLAPDKLPAQLAEMSTALTSLHQFASEIRISTYELAICWMLWKHPEVYCLFGAESAEQVKNNLASLRHLDDKPEWLWQEVDKIYPPQKQELLNPGLWH